MHFLSCATRVIAFLGVVAFALPCRADESKWVVTRSTGASTCPDGAALAAAVAQGRDGAPVGSGAVEVAFARDDAGYSATVRMRGARAGVRSLVDASASCAALGDAVVATILVLLDEAKPEPARVEPAETPPETPPTEKSDAYSALRIGGAANAGFVHFHRSSTNERSKDGVSLGGELRLFPHARHGLTVGFMSAGGVFGPSVQILEAGYSYALVEPRPLDGVSVAAYVDVGPAYGIVTQAGPAPDHKVFGAHGSIAADLLVYNVSLGLTAGYRGGVPLGGPADAWEGAFTASLRLGFLLDFGASTP